jgi:hypothetical protein
MGEEVHRPLAIPHFNPHKAHFTNLTSRLNKEVVLSVCNTGIPRGWFGGFKPPMKVQSFEKAGPNSQFCGIYICNNLISIRVSLIYKLSKTPN